MVVIRRSQPTFINNISQIDDMYLELPQKENIQAALGVPLEQGGTKYWYSDSGG